VRDGPTSVCSDHRCISWPRLGVSPRIHSTRLERHRHRPGYVAAGVTNDTTQTIGEVATDEFVRVMVTNALSPLRVIEQFLDLVTPVGQVAVMSSELGSVTDNTDGGWEVYRASKASLNTLMRCLVARRTADTRTYYVIAPGWVRTDMGGPSAPLDIDTSVRGVIYAMRARVGTRGLVFVDYRNELLPW